MARRVLKKPDTDWVLLAMAVFESSALLLLAFKDGIALFPLLMAVALPLLLVGQVLGLRRLFPQLDQSVLIIGNFLCALGIILLCRLRPDRAEKQFLYYLLGIGVMLLATWAISRYKHLKILRWPAMLVCVGLLAVTLVLGRETYGAKNWLNFGGFSLQASEFVKVGLVFVLATYMSERRTLRGLVPAIVFAGLCMGLIVLQKDLGAVLICFFVCLFMYYAATGKWGVSLLALAAAAVGAVVLYNLFDHVQLRVAMWQNPWTSPEDGGYQIIQALVAIGSGGALGLGFGLGSPTTIPVYDTDFIFAALCEEFGLVVGLLVLGIYVLLFLRAGMLALRSRTAFDALTCVGVLASLAIQTFLIVGGVIKMIPLTGVTLPFISYGGSSMLSSMAMLGILQGVSVRVRLMEEKEWDRARAIKERARLQTQPEIPVGEEPVFAEEDEGHGEGGEGV